MSSIKDSLKGTDRGSDAKKKLTGGTPKILQLQAQNLSQSERVKALGGEPKKGGPSILSRVFDVVSRPAYASANITKDLFGGPKGFNPISAGAKGITGKEKTLYSDVLQEHGIKGPLGGILGFAGDVLLDPTTYVGAGLVKTAGKGVLEAGAAKTAQKAIKLDDIAKAAKPARLAEQKRLGRKLTSKEWDDIGAAKESELLTNKINSEAAMATGRNKGAVEFKFMGKKFAESEGLYTAGGAAVRGIKKLPGVEKANVGFRTAAKLPGKTKTYKRVAESKGVAQFEQDAARVMDQISIAAKAAGVKMTKSDMEQVFHLGWAGTKLDGHLGEVQRIVQDAYDEVLGMETARDVGILSHADVEAQKRFQVLDPAGSGKIINPEGKAYQYLTLRSGNFEKKKAFEQLKRDLVSGKKDLSIREIQEMGYDIADRADEAFKLRLADSYTRQAQENFRRSVADEYGLFARSEGELKAFKDKGYEKFTAKRMNDKGNMVDEDYYAPKEISDAVAMQTKLFQDPDFAGDFIKHFDKVQSMWKTGATVINPGHHARNLMGDLWLNFIDGVKNPLTYKKAQEIVMAARKEGGAKLSDISVQVGARKFNGQELWEEFINTGGKSGFYRTEYGAGIGNRPVEWIRNKAEGREDWTRFAHWLDVVKKEQPKNFSELRKTGMGAAERVRKFNIDYADLTDFERNVMKRAVPFYTWMRKNVPLQVEALFMQPGRVAVMPKAQKAIMTSLGVDTDELPLTEIIPKWVREASGVRLRGEGEGATNPLYWVPPVPFTDIGKITEGFGKGGIEGVVGGVGGLLSNLSPMIRMPIEVGTGKQLFSGAPLKGSWSEYLMNQLPVARVTGQAAQMGTGGDVSTTKLLNYLSGLGITSLSEKSQLGELRRQQDPLQQQFRTLKEKLLSER